MKRIFVLSVAALVSVSAASGLLLKSDHDRKLKETSIVLSAISAEMNMIFKESGTFGVGDVTVNVASRNESLERMIDEDGRVRLPFQGSTVDIFAAGEGFTAVIDGLPKGACEEMRDFRSVTVGDVDGLDQVYKIGTNIGLSGAGIFGSIGCDRQPLIVSYKPVSFNPDHHLSQQVADTDT